MFNIKKYDPELNELMLKRCVNLMINCVSEGTEESKIAVYDVLYSYCRKFESNLNLDFEYPKFYSKNSSKAFKDAESAEAW